jgi:LuxR family maltose regulon positive regulatory protein
LGRPARGAGPLVQPDGARLLDAVSERELEVLRLIASGLSNAEIAAALIIAPATVKRHLNSLYSKLGVHSRTRALDQARKLHLLD